VNFFRKKFLCCIILSGHEGKSPMKFRTIFTLLTILTLSTVTQAEEINSEMLTARKKPALLEQPAVAVEEECENIIPEEILAPVFNPYEPEKN